MANPRPKMITVTSPRATLMHVYVNTPDDYKGVLKYKTQFTCDAAAARPLMAAMDAATDARMAEAVEETAAKIAKLRAAGENAKAKAVNQPKRKTSYEVLLDAEDQPTGKVRFSSTVNAEGSNAKGETWSNKPVCFDRFGKPTTVVVYGGSTAKVAVQLVPYAMADDNGTLNVGCSLRPKALQIIELVSKGQKSASGFGFEEEEGSYDGSSFTADDAADDSTDDNSTSSERDSQTRSEIADDDEF
ncbi:hypothetical protein [Phenylobacterium sp.]|uniref:hypothetical protein n=1 Tax=Phenylobacterium sp. TaxID=1871053 RepID=UPI002737E391|nr:hypothetical protein [Phenylobacterium sp.]MDP3869902.1 hypothetical protein [Phenylobacterium sp.]